MQGASNWELFMMSLRDPCRTRSLHRIDLWTTSGRIKCQRSEVVPGVVVVSRITRQGDGAVIARSCKPESEKCIRTSTVDRWVVRREKPEMEVET
jgi:hypothetical protein